MVANVAMRVSETVEEYLGSCQARGDKANTIKTKRGSLDKLLMLTGNILIRNVGPQHMDGVFAALQSQGLKSSTINLHRNNLTHFFKWCQSRRYIPTTVSPMDGIRALKVMPREMLRVPASKFGHLLDCASHPRDRVILAIALYTFLRQSEIKPLKVGDVNLDDGYLTATIEKTSQRDQMPVSVELDRELRSWLTTYGRLVGASLDPNWFLIPIRSRPQFTGVKGGGFSRVNDYETLTPTRNLARLEGIAQGALERAGYPIRNLDDSSRHIGMHTLRRSGARARYDWRVEEGYDGALREVQAMLHHSSTAMTERYLGITLDIKRRNESIRGQAMFPQADTATIPSLADRRVM